MNLTNNVFSPKPRILLLSDTINSEVVKDIMEKIIDISQNDIVLETTYGDNYKKENIQLIINSFGGSVYNGLALIDIMRNSNTKIDTYCYGSAMSMGFWIWLYGNKRYVGENSTLMYHEISSVIKDKLEGIKQDVKESERLQDLCDDKIKSISLITQEILNKYRTTKSEWYISPKEAIQYKLADDIK